MECDDHIHRIVQDRVEACKSDLVGDIHRINANISSIQTEQKSQAAELHKLNIAVHDIAINSASIAKSLEGMSGMFETYKTLVGINKLFGWMRENIIGIALLVAIFMALAGKLDLKMLLGWLV